MENLLKNSHLFRLGVNLRFAARKAVVFTAAFLVSISSFAQAADSTPAKALSNSKKSEKLTGSSLETYRDLIAKAQNLTLQRDRLQTSQVLIRGIQSETRSSTGYKELLKALNELTSVFYTEKAQTLYATGESLSDTKPREALDHFQEALRAEDGNLSILKAMARIHLRLGECDKADKAVGSSEAVNPFSAEVLLLRLQTLDCQKNFAALNQRLTSLSPELEPLERYWRGLQIKEHIRQKDFKKAKQVLAAWEAQSMEYPEVHYWKWELARKSGASDRAAALRYVRLCQDMTPRKRKVHSVDVGLCSSQAAVDAYLRENEHQSFAPAGGESGE